MTASGEVPSMTPDVQGLSHAHMLVASTLPDETLAGQLTLPAKRAGHFLGGNALDQQSDTTSRMVAETVLTGLMSGEDQSHAISKEQNQAQRVTFALRVLRQVGFGATLFPLAKDGQEG